MKTPVVDHKRALIQEEAVNAWELSNRFGVIEAVTGIGKNFMFLKALHRCPKNISVLFLAEQVDREYDLRKDIEKFDALNGTHTLLDYDFEFMTYQSAYKLSDRHWDFVCADEIHDSLTPEYSKFYFNNTFTYFVGLSATIPNTKYTSPNGFEYTKRDILLSIAPVCYKYTIKRGQEEKTTRPLNIIVVEGTLDSVKLSMDAGNKKIKFKTTEKKAYEYWEQVFNKAMFMENSRSKEFVIRRAAAKRAEVLYKLPSKVETSKKILSRLKGKTLVFGNNLDMLLQIVPDGLISSRNSDKENIEIRNKFKSGELNTIASFKKLKQGANLHGLNNILITSYYSSTKDLIQRIGRLRKEGEKVGNVVILLTKGTKEEDWFYKMFKTLGINELRISSENIEDIDKYLEYSEESVFSDIEGISI